MNQTPDYPAASEKIAPPSQTGPRCTINRAALEEAFDVAIAFHRENTNDPHNVGDAVIAALSEVKTALLHALR